MITVPPTMPPPATGFSLALARDSPITCDGCGALLHTGDAQVAPIFVFNIIMVNSIPFINTFSNEPWRTRWRNMPPRSGSR